MILAIDPGKIKCGLAVLNESGNVLEKKIVPRLEILSDLPFYLSRFSIATVIVGQGAFGKELGKELVELDLKINIVFVSEKNSTLEARKLYWLNHKPLGLYRFLPASLRVPPVPIDDYAAMILGSRYLEG